MTSNKEVACAAFQKRAASKSNSSGTSESVGISSKSNSSISSKSVSSKRIRTSSPKEDSTGEQILFGKSKRSVEVVPAARKVTCSKLAHERLRLEDEIVAAAGVTLVPVPTDRHHAWFVSSHRPSAAECRKQLEALQRSQNTGTEDAAIRKMAKALDKVTKAGEPFVTAKHPTSELDYSHMIESGAASLEWEGLIAGGEVPPSPFRSQGEVGRNGSFDLSAIRHWLWSKRHRDTSTGGSSGAKDTYKDADGGRRSCDVLRALLKGRMKGGLGGAESMAAGEAAPVTTARSFVEGMRPKGETGWSTPKWIQQLLDGQLQCALNFWE
jgi:hypothetical protein